MRRSRRFAASKSAARDLIERFGEAKDKRIIKEVVWAVHAQGDASLCEAKVMMTAGLSEDAVFELRTHSHILRMLQRGAQMQPDILDVNPIASTCLAYNRIQNTPSSRRCI